MNYQNTYRLDDWNSSIIEWDMKSANTSICKEYGLLPLETIRRIESMHKSKRERAIGLIGQKDKEFMKALESKFDEVMKIFIEQNDLDLDWDVISIRKDAAFIINREVHYPKVGKYIVFRQKGIYSHHLYLNPYDIYINSDTIDVKGINDKILPLHENGILSLLRMIAICEGSTEPKKQLNELFSDFVLSYKERLLDYDYYREFNPSSKFKINLFGEEMLIDSIDTEDLLAQVDISYNYEKIILPLIRLLR